MSQNNNKWNARPAQRRAYTAEPEIWAQPWFYGVLILMAIVCLVGLPLLSQALHSVDGRVNPLATIQPASPTDASRAFFPTVVPPSATPDQNPWVTLTVDTPASFGQVATGDNSLILPQGTKLQVTGQLVGDRCFVIVEGGGKVWVACAQIPIHP